MLSKGDALRKALNEFVEVKEVHLDEWHVPSFGCVESTTRVVRIVPKEGVTAEELPHLFQWLHTCCFAWTSTDLPEVPEAWTAPRRRAALDSHEHIMDADEAESTAPTKDDVSPHRKPSGQKECAGKSPTEPEAFDKEMTQKTVEEQERCDLAEDSELPAKRPRKDATTPNKGGSDR
ncbi:hypothetical protein HPB52_002286 [Rhipicephalus sanguineus]|uniref:Uncharacterized protein n=1 Tax=Rhipicephalus sanguineus TaxID=34632 RepID=A0A9D4SXC7_RHISA|nr:hypothetical protein HPB52_002286 [Rhipicephalus sanguineus]